MYGFRCTDFYENHNDSVSYRDHILCQILSRLERKKYKLRAKLYYVLK